MNLFVGVTGHRNINNSDYESIKFLLKNTLNEIKPNFVITGMAIGFDQLVAETCVEENIKFIAAIPFLGQEKIWPKHIQTIYKNFLKMAHEIKIVCEGSYEPYKMQKRNEWIVDNSQILIAYFDNNYKKFSGTKNCVVYANKQKKDIINLYEFI